jgi:hypothetical protein
MKLLFTLKCKRDAGYVDYFAVEMDAEEVLDEYTVASRISNRGYFELLRCTEGSFINLNNYYYYDVLDIRPKEDDGSES